MRLHLLLAFAVLPSVSLAGRSGTVYLQPFPPQTQKIPGLEPHEANSVLANYLGLRPSKFTEVIDDATKSGSEEWKYLWQPLHAENSGPYDRVMLLIQSDHPEDFAPSEPTFTMPNTPGPEHFEELVDTFVSQAHNIFDEIITSVLHTIHLASHPAELPSYKRLLDIFDMTPSESTALFMDELRSLASMVESPNDRKKGAFTVLRLGGLHRIVSEHGRNSEVYTTAAQTLSTILSHLASESRKLAIIVYPSDDRRRADTPASAPLKHGVIPIWSSSRCFTTSEACNNSTNNCSGHGSCVQVIRPPKTCWACTCDSTTNAKGRKTAWKGKACERVDYTVPFVLLAGTTVFLVIIFVGSVRVLYSIGDAELPNTLTSTSTSHLKRD